MRITFCDLQVGVLGILALGCTLAQAENFPQIAWEGRTMGSSYAVKIVDGKLSEKAVDELKVEIEKTLSEVNRQMSNYRNDSELSKFNRAPAMVPFKVSADFARVVKKALELSRQSDGAFDPTLGPLINLWGFGEKGQSKTSPTTEALRAAMARTGWRHLSVTPKNELIKDIPGLSLDLGALAKGFGVDQMMAVLHRHGLNNVYVSIAGEVRVAGHNTRGTKWVLGVSVPVDHWRIDKPMAAMLMISGRALSTSGDYQKFFIDANGRRQCHIIDGKSGAPVQHNLAAVTVVAQDSMSADGLSTILFILDAEAGLQYVEARDNVAALFIIREKDGSFRQVASSKFAAFTGYKP
jgi:thiamine biosynthesis lipoprotein